MNLRSDPSTLTARQPRPFAGTWKCEKSWSSQAWWSRSPTGTYLGDDDRGCSNADHEEGSTDPSGITLQNGVIPRSPCPSLDGVRPMLLETAMSRAPSLHRGGRPSACSSSPRERRRPRKGDAGRVDRRHGSSASSHGLHRPAPAARRNARWRTLGASSQDGPTSFAGKLPEARCASTARERGQERQLRAEEDSRLAGVPARRNALQRSVEWSQPREAVERLRPARSQRSPVGGGFDEGEHLGRRAARRGCPSALDEKATTGGTSA